MLVSGSSLAGHYACNEARHARYKWPPTMVAGYAVVPLRTGSSPRLVKARLSTPAVRRTGLQLESARFQLLGHEASIKHVIVTEGS